VTLPIGAVQGVLNVVGGPSAGTSGSRALAAGEAALGLVESGAGSAGIAGPAGTATHALGVEGASGVGSLSAPAGVEAGEAGAGVGGEAGGGFGDALTQAISQLEGSQQNASAASQALATGNTSDPEAAVVTVADAQLAMQLASQLRTKGTEALQQIFQTQV
jgi:flagellar hook-basal body complex protein FliE